MSEMSRPRNRRLCAAISLGLLCVGTATSLPAANTYLVHNLVSDLPGMADRTDPHLVNPWGLAFSATGPFWIGNNHSGTSTVYNTSGAPVPVMVNVPSPGASGTPGAATGVVFNSTPAFLVGGKSASFMFCTEDGTITGWNSSVDPTKAVIMIDNSATGAVYKGCATGSSSTGPTLYAANFNSGKIDVWDSDLQPVMSSGGFIDSLVPSGFAPFNVAVLLNRVYVAYAKQDSRKKYDVRGAGNGYVSIFDMDGNLLGHFLGQGPLNSPWGMAIAPATFGDLAGMLLVGNFGNGWINAFNPNTGDLIGPLRDLSGQPVVIQGLWALEVGNGGQGGDPNVLYFTAGIPGPNGEPIETHGLFGSIESVPLFVAILNSADLLPAYAPNTAVSIVGGALSATTRGWQANDFVDGKLPTALDGVSVTVNGETAYISYVSPSQINLIIPPDVTTGQAKLQITNNGLVGASFMINILPEAPALFLYPGGQYAAATHADFSPAGPSNIVPGITTTPVKPGETIILYGTGFGPTNPSTPIGRVLTAPLPLADTTASVTIGGNYAQVTFIGLVAPGLFQVNVVVPGSLPSGDTPVVVTANGFPTAGGVISINAPVVVSQ